MLGAKENVVKKTASVLKDKYPNLNIVGLHNGYFGKEQWEDISNILKKVNPDFIFVGITSPTKEYLIEYLQSRNINSVFMGVGGSFDVISGNIPRAPLLMQNFNLEWVFRVLQVPRRLFKRLFKRYFLGNNIFIKNIIKEKIKMK